MSAIQLKLYVTWSVLICASFVLGLVWVLVNATDPEYFNSFLSQSFMLAVGFLWLYFSTARHVSKGSEAATKRLKAIALFWCGLFLFLTLASVVPDHNRDDLAATRYTIALVVVGIIAGVHLVFWRRFSAS